jgi:hypothetical protein
MPDMAWLGYTVNCTGIQARDFFLTGPRHDPPRSRPSRLRLADRQVIDPDAGFSFVDGPHAGASGR